MNKPLTEADLTVEFPAGIQITDQVAGTKYLSGLGPVSREQALQSTVAAIQSARSGG